jgi:hypothetical protein
VSYLYTVVAVAFETDIGARLVSNCPAALFVNGRRVLANTAAAGDSTLGSVHLHADKNHILLKVVGDSSAKIAFALGNDDNIAADEFNNDLAELVEGYKELLARADATEETPAEARRLVTFHYEDAEAGAVSVVGSFNGWSPEKHRLQKLANGSWELTCPAPGRGLAAIDQKKALIPDRAPKTATAKEPSGGGQPRLFRSTIFMIARRSLPVDTRRSDHAPWRARPTSPRASGVVECPAPHPGTPRRCRADRPRPAVAGPTCAVERIDGFARASSPRRRTTATRSNPTPASADSSM